MRLAKTLGLALLCLTLGGTRLVAFAQLEDGKPLSDLPRQFAATAFGQSGATAGKSFGVNIYLTGWTTDEQVMTFIAALRKGQDALVSAMEKTADAGRLEPNGSVGTGVRFARYRKTANGGLHVVMATNRSMSFAELYRSGRSVDYPFTILVMDVGRNGKGTGKLALACKVKFNKKNQLEIENYGQKPFRLANVYLQK